MPPKKAAGPPKKRGRKAKNDWGTILTETLISVGMIGENDNPVQRTTEARQMLVSVFPHVDRTDPRLGAFAVYLFEKNLFKDLSEDERIATKIAIIRDVVGVKKHLIKEELLDDFIRSVLVYYYTLSELLRQQNVNK